MKKYKKSSTATAPEPAPSISISNCTFTSVPPSADVIGAAIAIAKACEQNAIALQLAASLMKMPEAPMLVFNNGERQ